MQELNLPHDVKYPSNFPKELLNGFISEALHSLVGKTVYVAGGTDSTVKDFLKSPGPTDRGQVHE